MTAPDTTAAAPPPVAAPVTPALVEVEFKGNRREFFTWARGTELAAKTQVIVEADRGEDLGRVYATGDLAARRKAGTTHGLATTEPLRAVLRVATRDEIAIGVKLRADEDNIRRRAIEKVRSQSLEMKVSDIEWQWDRKKLTVFFTAEKRVDFRQLVRQLEGTFGTRVQMWHIGVRDEARRLDGVGRCGRQYCSASWLPELRPVKSSVAKDQRLSTLNPAQISGSCGRLMCCLRYEHEFYVQQRKRFPKEGKVVVTLLGEEKVVTNDIFREQVTLRSVAGELRIVPLAQLARETGSEVLSTTAEHRVEAPDDDDVEEELLVEIQRAQVQRPPAAQVQRPPAPAPATPPAAVPTAPASPHADDTAAGKDARRKRRRGRRGGRRGRDGGGGGGSPPPGTPPAPPPHSPPPGAAS